MRIIKPVIDTINTSIQAYEIGGILGSDKGDVINEVAVDVVLSPPPRRCSYSPNVNYLNQILELWHRNKIVFKGVFHTHFAGVGTLSCGDKKYINTIMSSMPQNIDCLYFPIFVLPERKLVCYKAMWVNGLVDIQEEEVITMEK